MQVTDGKFPSAAGPELGAPSLAEPSDEAAHILIVDDLPEKLLVLGTVLEELNQNLVFVRSGAEALREVLQREFAVILLDVNMPDIDGLETASLIRKYKRSAHTPIIFITAYADEMQTAAGYSLGAVDYILSPVVPEMLRSKVKVFVDLYTMQCRMRRQADERVARVAAEAARQVAEENGRRSAFLSQASAVLSGSLDLSISMNGLLELLVPDMASLAMVLMPDETGALRRGRVASIAAGQLSCELADTDHDALPSPVRHALRQALIGDTRMQLAPEAVAALSPQRFGLAAAIKLDAASAVPLRVGERVLGVLVVGTETADQGLASSDWAALDELASRAAIAFENANLYRSLQGEIAERRAAETELQYANQRKDEFLAMLSHELRNPLAPIRNALEVVRLVAPPEHLQLKRLTDVMERQVSHMTRLVDELLDVARISEGKVVLHLEPLALQSVVSQSVETTQPTIDSRRLTLAISMPGEAVPVHGDPARLAQILSNLLHNAAKYTDPGGHIEVALTREGGQAVVTVRDNGIGIDSTLLSRIFDLFAQGSRALDRSQGGLGIGLTVARRLAELHEGRIDVKSDGLGKGSEFRVYLPCAEPLALPTSLAQVQNTSTADSTQSAHPASVAPSPTAELPAAAALSGPALPRRVLVVDDNRDAAESVAEFLQMEGHEAHAVYDSLKALECVETFSPEIVVLDIGLPMLTGYEVCKRMRKLPQTQHATLIAMTGYGQKEDLARAFEAGFDHHLVKPADPRELLRLIGRPLHAKPE